MSDVALYCYDGSEPSKAALSTGSALLGDHQAIVLTVWHPGHSMEVLYSSAPNEVLEKADADAEAHARHLSQWGSEQLGATAGTPQTRTRPVHGAVWRAILDEADAVDAAVIVMGSRGLGGMSGSLLGSVSHAVANHSSRPVLIIPPAE